MRVVLLALAVALLASRCVTSTEGIVSPDGKHGVKLVSYNYGATGGDTDVVLYTRKGRQWEKTKVVWSDHWNPDIDLRWIDNKTIALQWTTPEEVFGDVVDGLFAYEGGTIDVLVDIETASVIDETFSGGKRIGVVTEDPAMSIP